MIQAMPDFFTRSTAAIPAEELRALNDRFWPLSLPLRSSTVGFVVACQRASVVAIRHQSSFRSNRIETARRCRQCAA